MAEFQKFYGPITLVGHESRDWANINVADIATKGEVSTYVAGVQSALEGQISSSISAVRGGAVASGNTKDVTGGTVYSYLSDNSTVAGGTGKNGKFLKLDANGLIDTTALPPLSITNVQAGTTAPSDVQMGDVFVNTDESKTYIYNGTGWQEILTPVDGVVQVNGKPGPNVSLSASDVGAIATGDLVTSVTSESTDAKVPSAKAVYSFVNTNYSATGHTHTSANITDSISASSGITSSAAGLVQGKAVQAYVSSQISGLNLGTTYVKVADGISAASGITSTASGWVQGKAVEDYAAKKSHTHTSANVSDAISASSGIVTGESKLAQAGAVADYVTSAIGAIDYSDTYAAKSHTHVSADITDSISTAAGVTSTETKLVQAKGVQLYVAGQAASWTAGTTTVATTGTKFVTQTYLASAISSLDLANTYAAKTHSHTATDLPTATASEKGIASFGTGLSITSGAVTLSAATADALGGVKVGSGNGLAYSSNKITMSLANGTSAGTVKASTGITISSGNISVNFSTDISTDASSDVKAATPKAVKTYVDAQVGGVSAIGTITCNGTAKKYDISHSLGTSIIVQVVDADGNTVYVPVTRASGKVTVEFATAPANNTVFSVYITKVGGTAIAATAVTA